MNICIRTYLHTYTRAHAHACANTRAQPFIRTVIHTHIHTYIHTQWKQTHMHAYIHTHIPTYVHAYTHCPTHIHMHKHKRTCMHTYTRSHHDVLDFLDTIFKDLPHGLHSFLYGDDPKSSYNDETFQVSSTWSRHVRHSIRWFIKSYYQRRDKYCFNGETFVSMPMHCCFKMSMSYCIKPCNSASWFQILDALVYQFIIVPVHQRISVSRCQCISISSRLHCRIDVSICQCLHASMNRCISASMSHCANVSMYQCITVLR